MNYGLVYIGKTINIGCNISKFYRLFHMDAKWGFLLQGCW